MGFDLSAGSSISRHGLLEALKPSQPSSPIEPKPSIDERSKIRDAQERDTAPFLNLFEIRVVRERFEPLSPVLRSALRGAQDLGRELRTLRDSVLKQGSSLPPDPQILGSDRVGPERASAKLADPSFEPTPDISLDGTFLPKVEFKDASVDSFLQRDLPSAVHGPRVEPKPPQGIPVSGGLPVVLPGQSRPAPNPDPLFGVQEGERVRVGPQGGGVARVGEGGFGPQELKRFLREMEPGHLLILSQEALRLMDQRAIGQVEPGFTLQKKGFQGEESLTFLEVQAGENVAKTTVGGDNVPEPKAPEGSRRAEGAPERRDGGTVGAPPEAPLSNINRFEPPLPTNVRSRFAPVVAVNLLDLVL